MQKRDKGIKDNVSSCLVGFETVRMLKSVRRCNYLIQDKLSNPHKFYMGLHQMKKERKGKQLKHLSIHVKYKNFT